MNTAIFSKYDIPAREIAELKNCRRLIDLENSKKKKKDFSSGTSSDKSEPMNELLIKKLENHKLDASDDPHVNLIYHERLDGAVSSFALGEFFKKNGHSFLYNPTFKENKLSAYLKPSAIKRVAAEEGKWKEKSNFDAGFVFTTILSILSILLNIFFGSGIDLFNFKLPIVGVIILAVVAVGLAILSVVFFAAKRKSNKKASLDELESAVALWDDDEFRSFINKFSAEDYSAFSDDIILVNFSSYSRRARLVITNYLAHLRAKQCWFVFLENRGVMNEEMMSFDHVSVFSMEKLHFSKKRRLALEVKSREGISFRDESLNSFGVDRIFYPLLKNELTEDKKREVALRVKDFALDNEGNNTDVDVEMLISFVAELNVKLMVNFENPREWEYLFDYPDRDDETLEFDKRLTKELLFKGSDNIKDRSYSQLKKYVTDIYSEFSADFESIIASSTGLERLRGYQQLLALKALRIKNQDSTERLLNVAISLTDELYFMDDLDDYTSYGWDKVVTLALSVFERCNFRSFNCSIINRLISLAGSKRRYRGCVFSHPVILSIARSNLILGPNLFGAAADIEAYNRGIGDEDIAPITVFDTVRDHYLVLKYAKEEQYPEDNTGYGKTPVFFGLINMAKEERDEYYVLLKRASEGAVLEFYENLYDTLSASAQISPLLKISSYELYSNDLKAKYGRATKTDEYAFYSGNTKYVALLLDRMLSLVAGLYRDDDIIFGRVEYIRKLFKSDGETGGEIILELADAEFSGISLLCYLVSMTARVKMENDAKILENMYLSIGSYVVRLVFLVYHESVVSSLYNTDVQHLVRIITSYEHPDAVVLGLLGYYDRVSMPGSSRGMITDYLHEHKSIFVEGWKRLIGNIGSEDHSEMIERIASSSSLENDMKTDLFKAMLERIRENELTPVSRVFVEFLTLRIDGCQSPEFRDLDNSEIADMLSVRGVNPNMKYLILSEYIKLDSDRFISLTVPLYGDLMLSNYVRSEELIIGYFEKLIEDETLSDEYIDLLDRYTSISMLKDKVSLYTWQSTYFKRVFTRITDSLKERNDPRCGKILERLTEFSYKLAEEHRAYVYIDQREKFFAHVWSHGAILRYLRYLIDNSGFSYRTYTSYSDKTDDEKRQYIQSSVGSIGPLITHEDSRYVNTAYSDMINMFLNNTNNIQSRLGEDECMLGFFADATTLVEAIFGNDPRKADIIARLSRLESAFKSIS